jgi:IclR family transcriptional regulator, pca regulon regulatory protein
MLLRGLQVLETFTPEQPALTMVEVAERAGIHRAAARRYLLTLTELGYLRTEPGPSAYGSPRWRLTPRALRLGYSCLASLDVWRIIEPYIGDVATATGLAADATVLDEQDVVCVASAPLEGILRVHLPPGTRHPAEQTTGGRVLLAGLSPADLETWLAEADPSIDAEQLRTVLKEVTTQGYAFADGELEPGLWSMAVPVRQPDPASGPAGGFNAEGRRVGGRVVAALNVAGHTSLQLSERERDHKLLPTLRHAAALIGEAGATHPSGLWLGATARLRRTKRPQQAVARTVPFRYASDGRR